MKKIIMIFLCCGTGIYLANEQDFLAEALKLIIETKSKIKTPADIFTEKINQIEKITITNHVELSSFKKELVKFLNEIKFTPEGELDLTDSDKKAAWEFFYGTKYINKENQVLQKAVEGYAGITPEVLDLNYPKNSVEFLWHVTMLLGEINSKIISQKNNIYNQSIVNLLKQKMLEYDLL